MPNFGGIITLAYMRILNRPPDPGGLESYNRLMNQGLTEAQMREALLRSPEYAQNNPDRAARAAGGRASKRKTSPGKKKGKSGRRRR
jgi:hypothetical protein